MAIQSQIVTIAFRLWENRNIHSHWIIDIIPTTIDIVTSILRYIIMFLQTCWDLSINLVYMQITIEGINTYLR